MTETEVERLIVRLVGDASSYSKMMADAPRAATAATGAINSSIGKMATGTKTGLLSTAAAVVAFAGNASNALMGVKMIAGSIASSMQGGFGLVMDAEKAQASFKTMLGDGAAAEKMMKDIRSFAAATPMSTADLVQSGKTLMQFGVAGENVLPIMKMLGDTAGGDSQRFSQMSLAFGQMAATGRLMGQDLNQMINAGFNPLKEMARTTGQSMEQLKAKMEQGGISANMVVKAFQSATSEGGQFAGMMGEQSKTLGGLWSTFGDNVSIITMQAYEKIVAGLNLKGILAYVISFLDTFSANFEENFAALTSWLSGLWTTWIEPFVSVVTEWGKVIMDWAGYAGNTIMTFVGNAIGFFANFNQNIGKLWDWLGENWKGVLTDMLNLIGTFTGNMAHNIGVGINMQVRLWMAFNGWLGKMFTNLFSFEMVDALLTGLIMVGEKLRNWASAAWETIQSIFKGKKGEGALDSFIEQAKSDLAKGAEDNNFINTAAKIIEEESKNLKNPLEGFQSALTDLPEMNLTTAGVPLPEFVWKTGQDSNKMFGNAVKGMADPLLKEANKMKGIDAVAADSAEALSRIAEYQAGRVIVAASGIAQANPKSEQNRRKGDGFLSPGRLSEKLAAEATLTNPEENAATLDMIAAGIQALVEIGIKQLGEPGITFATGGSLA